MPHAKTLQVQAAASRSPHVLLYGMFGIGNTGNDATLEVTAAALNRLLPGVRLTVIATHPERVAQDTGLACTAIRPEPRQTSILPGPARRALAEADRWAQARDLVRSADCLLVPGTGIFDDLGVTAMQHAYQLWKWTEIARQEGVPVKFVSIGAGPVAGAWSRRFFRWTAMSAEHRSYRDEGSKTFMSEVLRVDASSDEVTPDLVFGLDIAAPRPAASVQTVGIGVMDYHSWRGATGGSDDAYGPYMEKLAAFCQDLLEQGKALHVLCGDIGDAPAVEDLCTRLRRAAPARAEAVTTPEVRTLRDLCQAIAATDAVVATRYHTIVGALMCGRPAVSIGYAAKNRAVMEAFGQGRFCQNIWDFDLDALRAHFAEATVAPVESWRDLSATSARLHAEVTAHLERVGRDISRSRR